MAAQMQEKLKIREHYFENGYYFPIDAIPADMARDAAARYRRLIETPPKGINHPWAIKTHLLADWVFELTTHPAVLDAVEVVIGPNILMQAADTFIKPARNEKIVNWHQDANYWGLQPFELVTAWIALSDVTPQNGCMRYLPGSHRQAKVEHIETFAANSALTRGQEIALEIDEAVTVDVALTPGQISLHHCLLAHASGPNTTDNARIGLAVRYLSTHVRQTEGPPMSAILVRGHDAYDHFQSDPAPTGAFTAETIAAHAAAMTPHKVSGYATA